MYCASPAKTAGSTLTATSRPSLRSRARYTSPMPPAPSGERISYGPSLVPADKLMVLVIISEAQELRLIRTCRSPGNSAIEQVFFADLQEWLQALLQLLLNLARMV